MQSKSFKWKVTGWSGILFYAICGLLLLLWPDMALQIANYALAAVLCVIGLAMVIGYIRGDAMEGMLGYGMAKGLLLILLGAVLLIRSDILLKLLPFLWGVAMVAGGFTKMQMAFDLKRIGHARWWLMLIGALISFLLGAASILQPEFVAIAFTQFAGIALLVEAALDLTAVLVMKRELKHLKVFSGTV